MSQKKKLSESDNADHSRVWFLGDNQFGEETEIRGLVNEMLLCNPCQMMLGVAQNAGLVEITVRTARCFVSTPKLRINKRSGPIRSDQRPIHRCLQAVSPAKKLRWRQRGDGRDQ